MNSVYTPLKNRRVDELFARIRKKQGQRVIPRKGAIRRLLKLLQQQEKVAVLLDQNTRLAEGGVFVEFFGVPALVTTAPAALALKTGTTIIFGLCKPRRDGTYAAYIPGKAIDPRDYETGHEEDAIALTRAIMGRIEEAIREDPGYWLWMYKRWKYINPATPRSRYPFYAKLPHRVQKEQGSS